MNPLSWFLYLADIIGNFQNLLIGFSILLGISTIVWLLAKVFGEADKNDDAARNLANALKWSPASFFLVSVLATVLPSKEVLYLIAGSEAGEAVVNSQEGKEILSNISEVIKHQLNQLKGETK